MHFLFAAIDGVEYDPEWGRALRILRGWLEFTIRYLLGIDDSTLGLWFL